MMLEAAIWVEEDDRDQNMIHIDEGKMSCKIFLHTQTTCQLFPHKKIYS